MEDSFQILDEMLIPIVEIDEKETKKKIKSKLRLDREFSPIYVIAIAIHKNDELNRFVNISTSCGDPIHTGIHDLVRDHYEVRCADHIELGVIPFSFSLSMEGIHGWSVDVPLPQVVIEKYLDDEVQASYKTWKEKCSKDYRIEYLQFLGAY